MHVFVPPCPPCPSCCIWLSVRSYLLCPLSHLRASTTYPIPSRFPPWLLCSHGHGRCVVVVGWEVMCLLSAWCTCEHVLQQCDLQMYTKTHQHIKLTPPAFVLSSTVDILSKRVWSCPTWTLCFPTALRLGRLYMTCVLHQMMTDGKQEYVPKDQPLLWDYSVFCPRVSNCPDSDILFSNYIVTRNTVHDMGFASDDDRWQIGICSKWSVDSMRFLWGMNKELWQAPRSQLPQPPTPSWWIQCIKLVRLTGTLCISPEPPRRIHCIQSKSYQIVRLGHAVLQQHCDSGDYIWNMTWILHCMTTHGKRSVTPMGFLWENNKGLWQDPFSHPLLREQESHQNCTLHLQLH